MWSAVAAERLGIIRKQRARRRGCRKTLTTLERMERYGNTGQYFNWYDHRTGAKLLDVRRTTRTSTRWLSSVDNGWLAVGLKIVENSVPQLRKRAGALYDAMDLGFYYRPDVNRVLFHYQPGRPPTRRRAATTRSSASSGSSTTSASRAGSCRRRRTSAAGARSRTPATGPGQETKPVGGVTRTYFGVDVFEGAYPYAGMRVVPSLGREHVRGADAGAVRARGEVGAAQLGHQPPAHRPGADLPRPEARPATATGASRRRTCPRAATASTASTAIGMDPNGGPSNEDNTLSTTASRAARAATREARPAAVGVHERRRHAARLVPRAALRAARGAATTSRGSRATSPASTRKWGFRDSVNVQTGRVSERLPVARPGDDHGRARQRARRRRAARAFADRDLERTVRPVIGIERVPGGTLTR